MKDDGEEPKKREEEKKKEEKKKKPRKKHTYGGLPSMEDAKQVTTESDSGVARSMGAVAPMHQMGGLPGLQPGQIRSTPFGAKLAPSMTMMASSGPRVEAGTEARKAPYGWKFEDVPTLPEFHPLERTAVFAPHTEAPKVGRRVANILRERSIATVYDDKKAKAKCVTESNVEFRVRLYRGRNKFSHGIICEVQRRFGFSPSFAGDMYAILDAAEGKPPAPVTMPLIPMPETLIPLVSDLEDDDEEDDFDLAPSAGEKRKATGSTSLLIACDMLKRAKTADANVLALESLASLTDATRMGVPTALRVSRQILSGDGEGMDIRDAVVSLLVDETLDIAEATADIWDKDDEGRAELRLYAMTIFCNAVTVIASSEPALLKEQADFLADDIVPTLVAEMRASKKSMRMAVVAARCLKVLLTSRVIQRDMIGAAKDAEAEPAVKTALDVGQRGNSHLEEASAACLKALQ